MADPAKMRAVIKQDVLALKAGCRDARRTQILAGAPDTEILTVTDLLPDREVLVLVDGMAGWPAGSPPPLEDSAKWCWPARPTFGTG